MVNRPPVLECKDKDTTALPQSQTRSSTTEKIQNVDTYYMRMGVL